MMIHPEKWRETIELKSLVFQQIEILEILGYPHAGNDIFHVRALHEGSKVTAFIKVERQQNADIENEINILSKLPFPFCPIVLEYSLTEPKYIVTKEVHGERLSYLVKTQPKIEVANYLYKQGATLSMIHGANISCDLVKARKFHDMPSQGYCLKHELSDVYSFLMSNKPKKTNLCFIHGDFHYGNMLWYKSELACVLDYEFSGMGNREFDMSWSIVLRPSQKFLTTMKEVNYFLKGYKSTYQKKLFYYYYVLIGSHFYSLGDKGYQREMDRLMKECIHLYGKGK